MAVELRPLPARSVILSILLGSHPPRLPVRVLVALGDLLDISAGSLRVALSRMTADGEVVASQGCYELSPHLLGRQRRLDEGRSPETRSWRGRWELAVLRPGLTMTRGKEVAEALAGLRLATPREGTWLRPDNLVRAWPADLIADSDRFEARPQGDPAALAGRLWELDAWTARSDDLLAEAAAASSPARRFAVAAAMARHLRTDPVLPHRLLPDRWSGPALRAAYRSYERELNQLLRQAGGA